MCRMICSRLTIPHVTKALYRSQRSLSEKTLSYTKHGARESEFAPIIFLHGLFGSKINFSRHSRKIAADLKTETYCLDCRNHGSSPWYDSMYLPELCEDVVKFAKQQNLDKVNLVGHSLGGKQACLVCAYNPELVQSAVIVDIFPTNFTSTVLDETCTALLLLDTLNIKSRNEASLLLANQIKAESERNFILSNLLQVKGGGWRWRCNLDTISQFTEEIRCYPDNVPVSPTNTLFLYGGESDYMSQERVKRTEELFSSAQFQKVEGAGHIVHLDQPEQFYTALRNFLLAHGAP
ncbi:hypothetical protein ACHWQZ_G012879 [Mnemiopsis leidyi]